MSESENSNAVERHGCLVCARVFNLLAVYSPNGSLVGCTVTSPGGRVVPDDNQPLVACDRHTADEVEAAYKKWKSRKGAVSDRDEEEE
jgi:hypothetical protein